MGCWQQHVKWKMRGQGEEKREIRGKEGAVKRGIMAFEFYPYEINIRAPHIQRVQFISAMWFVLCQTTIMCTHDCHSLVRFMLLLWFCGLLFSFSIQNWSTGRTVHNPLAYWRPILHVQLKWPVSECAPVLHRTVHRRTCRYTIDMRRFSFMQMWW